MLKSKQPIAVRLLSQNEITAIQKQIIVSNIINKENKEDLYTIFDVRFHKMKKYLINVEFLKVY